MDCGMNRAVLIFRMSCGIQSLNKCRAIHYSEVPTAYKICVGAFAIIDTSIVWCRVEIIG
jgi:hypothetical protein